jgi:hypothetical protein
VLGGGAWKEPDLADVINVGYLVITNEFEEHCIISSIVATPQTGSFVASATIVNPFEQ